ncbi:MAG: addiction module protein [Terriglobia bacterium]
MSVPAEKLLNQAMRLSVLDRAALIEGLITSLDKPDPALDALWLREAESRLAAYHAGELEAIDAEEVFTELGRKT